MRIFLLTAVLLLVGAVPGISSQTAGNDQVPLGRVEIYLFSPAGLPQEGVQVTLENGDVYRSNSNGLLLFASKPGEQDFRLFLQGEEVAKVSLEVLSGKTVDAVVNLQASGIAEPGQTWVESQGKKLAEEPQEDLSDRPRGKAAGQLVHIETGKGIAGALVIFRGWDQDIRTDSEGKFLAEVPIGTWSVSLVHPEFSTQTLPEVKIEQENTPEVKVQMTPSAIQLESLKVLSGKDIKVQGGLADLLEEGKNSSVVLSLIGAEQISRTGDSDAAQALSRVTGLTIVDGKYVFVRGMGDRYSSSTMNGSRLPSPEIEKRVVPLDLFPAAILESLAIQKTFSPDMAGEFGGGTVNIRTQGIPQDRFQRRLRGSFGISTTVDPGSTFAQGLLGHEGAWDLLGFDDGSRKIIPELSGEDAKIVEESIIQEGYTPAELAEMAKKFSNTWVPQEQMVLPGLSLSLALRDKYELPLSQELGWSASVLYKINHSVDEKRKASYQDPAGTSLSYDYQVKETSKGIDLGGLLNLAYAWNRMVNLESTSFAVRTTENSFKNIEGFFVDSGPDQYIRYRESGWTAQSLIYQKMSLGGMLPGGYGIQADYAFSQAGRDQPDHLYYRYDRAEGVFLLNTNAAFPLKVFAEVDDSIQDLSGFLTLPLTFLPGEPWTLKAGGSLVSQIRNSGGKQIKFIFDLFADPEDYGWASHPLSIKEPSRGISPFSGTQDIQAGFVNLDLSLFGWLRLGLGARYESSLQEVDTLDFSTGKTVSSRLAVEDILPALNMTVTFPRDQQIRLSGYRTVNRPDLTELSASSKVAAAPGETVVYGNPQLRRAVIDSADLRYEWYPSATESFSVGGFYKQFTDAIESSRIPGADPRVEFLNVPHATNLGVELEWTLSLRGLINFFPREDRQETTEKFIPARQMRGHLGNFFRDLNFSGNFSWIQSVVDYQGSDRGQLTSEIRPLQGQSPWIFNLTLGYKNSLSWFPDAKSDTAVNLNYNVFGPRIVELGAFEFPDAYEQPFHQMDLVVKHRFNEFWTLDFKARNLLDLPSMVKAGEVILDERSKGRSFSLGVKYDF